MSRIDRCRSCSSPDLQIVLNLGHQPLANALPRPSDPPAAEAALPLEIALCRTCALVQVTERVPPDILFASDYPYYSSVSPALLRHSAEHVTDLVSRRPLGPESLVVEVASNDGYLLKNFVAAGIPVLGIDPAAGPAEAARRIGVHTLTSFFSTDLARDLVAEGHQADVILGNNVLAHVDGINGFVAGFALLLKPDGIAEFEFPWLVDLVEKCAFDTIYHEHVFYYSLTALEPLFARHGLHLNEAVRLPIHGGSLRITVSRQPGRSNGLEALLAQERRLGVDQLDWYGGFADRVSQVRTALRALVADLRARGHRIAAYGAAAKGATLLNFAGLTAADIDYAVDRNPHKQGRLMPGSRLPIRPPEALDSERPDHLLLLAWNFAEEIMAQQAAYAANGGQFIVPVPVPRVVTPESLRGAA